MNADILIKNGRCLSMDGGAVYDWLAVKDGVICALGCGSGCEDIARECAEIIDARSCTVLPGFIDSHFHVVQTALNRTYVDMSEARSIDDIGMLIRENGRRNPELNIYGIGLDDTVLKERRLPTRFELDRFWDSSAVWLNSRDYLSSVLNTYGLLYYKIPFTKIGVELDEKNMPTGVFRSSANAHLRGNILNRISDYERFEALEKLLPVLAESGVTTINAMEGGYVYADRDALFINDIIRQKLPYPDMVLFFQTTDLEKIPGMGLSRVGGNLYVDGTFSARTAAISAGYRGEPQRKGALRFTQEALDEFVEACYRRGIQTSLYTVGDRAIDMAVKAHERAALLTGNTTLRHRLEHVELPTAEHMEKSRELGLIYSMQPSYEGKWGGPGKMYEDRIGEEYKKTNPFREILDAGVVICGGTDSDLTDINYIKAIHDAVNHPVSSHSVGVEEAARMFTAAGAYAIFEEGRKGYLKEGYIADIAVLDRDITAVAKDRIEQARVRLTVKSGRIVYSGGRDFSGK